MTGPVLEIEDLCGGPRGIEVVKGVTIAVGAGEVHALMGPNGSGKSTLVNLVMGHPDFEVTAGSVRLGGRELTGLAAHERAQAGLFASFQYPTELPGVPLSEVVRAGREATGQGTDTMPGEIAAAAGRLGIDLALLERGLNADYSGGEKKRAEILQLAALNPRAVLLDEIDSGLDVDGLRLVAAEIERLRQAGLAVILITHYRSILDHLLTDSVHVFGDGRILRTGGPELAAELEEEGYVTSAAAESS